MEDSSIVKGRGKTMENFKSTIKRNLDLSGLPLDMIHASIIEVI
jgi:hypothetical protein